jgi:hypothetical protein
MSLFCLFSFCNEVWNNFGGDSSNSKKDTVQKKSVRLMAGVKTRNSWRSLFKRLEILAVPSEYIISLMNVITYNQEHF